MGEGNDNRPRLPLGARPLTFPRRLLGPKLAKSPSAASGAVIQQRRGGRHPARKRSRRAAGASRAQIRNAREPGRRRAPTFPAFRGAPFAPGAGSLFLNRSCYLGVVFPIVPDQELLARRDWLREEKRQATAQSERRLLAGRGGAGRGRRAALLTGRRAGGQPGRKGSSASAAASRAAREGTLCWREDLTSWPPPPPKSVRWRSGSDTAGLNLKLLYASESYC